MADSTRYVLLLAIAAAARFLVLADFMIADLIAPSLQSSFQTSPTTLLLARNAMPITVTIGIPLAVLLVGRVGLKTIYLAALACFVLALLISAHASNLAWFVVGRVLQGCATAIVSSQVFALLWVFAPRNLLNRGIALVAGMGAFGMTAGPILASLGGAGHHWRSIFDALAMVALLLIPLAWLSMGRPIQAVTPIQQATPYLGASLLFSTWALLLTPWPAGTALASAEFRSLDVITMVGLILWLRQRRQRQDGPWRQPMFLTGFLIRLALFGAIATPGFFTILYLQNQLSWSMSQAALMGAAVSAPMLLGIPLSSHLMRRLQLPRLIGFCLPLVAIGLLGWIWALEGQLVDLMVLCNGVIGIGIGLLIPATTTCAMQTAGRDNALDASGWLVLAEALGPMLGLASQSRILLNVTRSLWHQAMANDQLPAATIAIDLNHIQQALPLASTQDQQLAMRIFLHGLQSVYLCSSLIIAATAMACIRLLQSRQHSQGC